jgi:glutamyl-tRNA synthetase
MTVVCRFAPSPTGLLHVGNARVALVNRLFARRAGGRFLLRLDDTDAERSRPEFAAAIRADLRWLGLEWDDEFRQSERLERYRAAAERLKAAGRLYPCYETAEELEAKRRRALRAGKPPVYDRAALALADADRARLEAEGRRPHWRFRLDHADIAWTDLVRGPVHFHGAHLSDPVLVRADGTFLYQLPSVVDDAETRISHVIRGEDHVANTAVQIQVFAALGAPVPIFAHLPLLTDAAGAKLSKRLESLTLESLRAGGIEPMALNSLLAHLGTSDDVAPFATLDQLAAAFDIAHFGRAAPRFDPAELARLNARLLHGLPFAAVAERLKAMGLARADARFWEAVRPNLAALAEAAEWHAVCFGTVHGTAAEPDCLAEAARLLPPEPWDDGTWKAWTEAVKAATGRAGKALYRPLRLALTGRDRGPEMHALLPLIGRARALDRLTAAP